MSYNAIHPGKVWLDTSGKSQAKTFDSLDIII